MRATSPLIVLALLPHAAVAQQPAENDLKDGEFVALERRDNRFVVPR
jgi:hypothetical protein